MPKQQAMPQEDAAGTDGKAEESAREAYHGGETPAQGAGRPLGRKDPQEAGSADGDVNVPQR